MDENELMQQEFAEFMRRMRDKYFISTWVYSFAIHNDAGASEYGEFEGSLPEALGLCINLQDHIKEVRGSRE